MTPLQQQLIQRQRGLLKDLEEQISAMERGEIRFLRGPDLVRDDATPETIEWTKRQCDAIRDFLASVQA